MSGTVIVFWRNSNTRCRFFPAGTGDTIVSVSFFCAIWSPRLVYVYRVVVFRYIPDTKYIYINHEVFFVVYIYIYTYIYLVYCTVGASKVCAVLSAVFHDRCHSCFSWPCCMPGNAQEPARYSFVRLNRSLDVSSLTVVCLCSILVLLCFALLCFALLCFALLCFAFRFFF